MAAMEAPVSPNRVILVEMSENIKLCFWYYLMSFVLGLRCVAASRASSSKHTVWPRAPWTQRSRDVLFEAAA